MAGRQRRPPLRSMRVKQSCFLVTWSQINIFIVTLNCQLSLSASTLLVRQRSCYWCVLQSQSSCISIYSCNQQSMCKSHHSPHVNRSQRYTLWFLAQSHWCVSATGTPAPQILIPVLGKWLQIKAEPSKLPDFLQFDKIGLIILSQEFKSAVLGAVRWTQ